MINFECDVSRLNMGEVWEFLLERRPLLMAVLSSEHIAFRPENPYSRYNVNNQNLFHDFCATIVELAFDSGTINLGDAVRQAVPCFLKQFKHLDNCRYRDRRRNVPLQNDDISIECHERVEIKVLAESFINAYLDYNSVEESDRPRARLLIERMLLRNLDESFKGIMDKYPNLCYNKGGDKRLILRNLYAFNHNVYKKCLGGSLRQGF